MQQMTGQEVVALALSRLAGGRPVKLAKRLRLREISDADNLGRQVTRWANGEIRPPGDVVIRALYELGAIRRAVLEGDHQAALEEARAELRAAQAADPARRGRRKPPQESSDTNG